MKKKYYLLVVTLLIVFLVCVSTIVVSSATRRIYFELPKQWASNSKEVYCHIWIDGGSEYSLWQSDSEKMTELKDNIYYYDLPEGNWNMVVFSTDTDFQTYDLCMGSSCFEDTVYVTEQMVENPIDSQKTCYLSYWENNKKEFTPYGNPKVICTDTKYEKFLGSKNIEQEENSLALFIVVFASAILVISIIIVLIIAFSIKKKDSTDV